jgi:DNA topoisomerase 2-associated protein PAT1
MSFFGFDATLPRDRAQNPSGPSFAHSSDAFAGLSRPADDDEDA